MGTYKEVDGDLILMAKQGKFDVVAHGCNCMCRMKRGIAPQMHEAFECANYLLEDGKYIGDINKLGQISYMWNYLRDNGTVYLKNYEPPINPSLKVVAVVNAYTQYHWDSNGKPLDYEALTLCMRKMNHIFKGKHIGLPKIGAGLAGGDWPEIKLIIRRELKDCDVTLVNYVQ